MIIPFATKSKVGSYSFLFSETEKGSTSSIGVSDDGIYQEMRLLFDSLEVPIRRIAAQLLLELSKQRESRELIISDGCVPHVVNRTNDVHCGEDASLILLELSRSKNLLSSLTDTQTIAAFSRSLRDADTLTWQSNLCMALTNALCTGLDKHIPTTAELGFVEALVDVLAWSLCMPSRSLSSTTSLPAQGLVQDGDSPEVGREAGDLIVTLLEEALPKVGAGVGSPAGGTDGTLRFRSRSNLLFCLANIFCVQSDDGMSNFFGDDGRAVSLLGEALAVLQAAFACSQSSAQSSGSRLSMLVGILGTLHNILLLLLAIDRKDGAPLSERWKAAREVGGDAQTLTLSAVGSMLQLLRTHIPSLLSPAPDLRGEKDMEAGATSSPEADRSVPPPLVIVQMCESCIDLWAETASHDRGASEQQLRDDALTVQSLRTDILALTRTLAEIGDSVTARSSECGWTLVGIEFTVEAAELNGNVGQRTDNCDDNSLRSEEEECMQEEFSLSSAEDSEIMVNLLLADSKTKSRK